jgi:hypothetical protein
MPSASTMPIPKRSNVGTLLLILRFLLVSTSTENMAAAVSDPTSPDQMTVSGDRGSVGSDNMLRGTNSHLIGSPGLNVLGEDSLTDMTNPFATRQNETAAAGAASIGENATCRTICE